MDQRQYWEEIIRRLEAGESQGSIARSVGWSRGRLRYRLQKYRESLAEAERQTAAAGEAKMKPLLQPDPGLLAEDWDERGIPDRLILLIKDPWTLHASWLVGDLRRGMVCEHFESDWGSLPLSLRLHDVTDIHDDGRGSRSCRVEDVSPSHDSWYFNGLEPGRLYVAEFGTWTIDGRFFAILRSNTVTTPPVSGKYSQPCAVFADRPVAEPQAKEEKAGPPFFPGGNEPWAEQFDGYRLVERDREVNRR